MKLLWIVALAVIAACSPVQKYQSAEQPVSQQRVAGPGGVVLRINKERDLKNVFGAADVWGRKTNEGFTELRFAGLEPDGSIILFVRDVSIETNETTMSRSGLGTAFSTSNTTFNANTYGNSLYGSANTTGTTTVIGPASDYHIAVPSGAIPVRLPGGTKSFPFEGYTIRIIAADPVVLTYLIEQ